MKWATFLALGFLAFTSTVRADDSERIRALENAVYELRYRVSALEQGGAPNPDGRIISAVCVCNVTEYDPGGGNSAGRGLQANLDVTLTYSSGRVITRTVGTFRNNASSWAEQVCQGNAAINPVCRVN